MTKSVQYRCYHCKNVQWEDIPYGEDIPEAIDHYCYVVDSDYKMPRVWSAPHTGMGSSGEKPK